jgi:alpha-mannosidase
MISRARPTALGPSLGLLLVLATEAFAFGDTPPCPAPGTRPASEACVRAELGIPPDAKRVVIVSQTSHLDWDWRHTFDEYFQGPLTDPLLFIRPGTVETIFSDALGLMAASHASGAHYYYSVAEMGYLQRFVAAQPARLDALQAVGQDLRIVGGGITSPDSLLPPGEAFIRDYLVGKTWVDATLGLPIRQAWVPDDFGHDAQLPIVLEAMGFEGVGFGRVPGITGATQSLGFTPPDPGSIAADLLRNGPDFVWRAADGSTAVAHWMPGGYCQGDFGLGGTPDHESLDGLARLIAIDGDTLHTGYVFIPVGCDFSRPRPDLLELVAAWNADAYARTGVWAVEATFDHYVQLLAARRAALPVRRFDPTPYWTGFYATRPLLKTMHLRATYALLAAETFGALADGAERRDAGTWRARVQARTAAIHAGWATLVPANHHDFITGTALDPVYESEQLPRLADALAAGEAERKRALDEIVAAVHPRRGDGPATIVVFNPLGFARRGLVAAPGVPTRQDEQASADGGRLFFAHVPSLGYATADRARTRSEVVGHALLTAERDGSVVVLENQHLRATLSRDSGWGIVSLIDKRTGREVIRSGEAGNALVPYADDGGLYRFGSEMEGCGLVPQPAVAVAGAGSVLETGPLRARFVADMTVDGRPFRKEYQLVAGEPYLRMISTGSAAAGTSVMVQFPLSGPIDRLIHGTPYHWDRKRPERAGELTFEATHDFLVPEFRGHAHGAIFHAGAPAWAVRRDGLVVGALWRNAPQERCDFYGADGSDGHEVAVAYALRVPTGIRSVRSGNQLREALSFHEPLLAVAGRPSGRLPRSASLVRATPSSAIVTAAKAGTADPSALILRVYQPTNRPLRVVVRTQAGGRFPAHRRLGLEGVTALEAPLSRQQAARLRLKGSASRFTFVAARALTTIAVRDQAR